MAASTTGSVQKEGLTQDAAEHLPLAAFLGRLSLPISPESFSQDDTVDRPLLGPQPRSEQVFLLDSHGTMRGIGLLDLVLAAMLPTLVHIAPILRYQYIAPCRVPSSVSYSIQGAKWDEMERNKEKMVGDTGKLEVEGSFKVNPSIPMRAHFFIIYEALPTLPPSRLASR